MEDEPRKLLRIGEVAHLSGVPVKTVRFYSDRGLLPVAERTSGGYRLYDEEALARLELVRALRELGVGLDAIERVLARELDLDEVVALQIRAVDTQIRFLRLRRAALAAVAKGEFKGKEVKTMTKLAQLSDSERRRMVEEFLDETIGDLDVDPGLAERMRAGMPELPDDPSPEQLEAWVEFAELIRDPDFRAQIRAMSERGAQARASGEGRPDSGAWQRLSELVAERAGKALADGVDPGSAEARAVADELAAEFAAARGAEDGPELRKRLADELEQGTDPRAERYWQLLAIINGWPPVPTRVPAWQWLIAALRAS